MAKNAHAPKINQFPLPQLTKMPIEQAIAHVGHQSGMSPTQAGQAAALMNAGFSPGKTKIVMANPRARQQ